MELVLSRGRRWTVSATLAFASMLVVEFLGPRPAYREVWTYLIRGDFSCLSHINGLIFIVSLVSLVCWTLVWYGLLSLLVVAWKRYHRMPLNSGRVRRWIGSAALALLSMVIVGWPVIGNVRDLLDLDPIYLPTKNAVVSMFPNAFDVDDETVVPKLWTFAFYCLAIVSWTLVWYAALSVLLGGIKRIRFRA